MKTLHPLKFSLNKKWENLYKSKRKLIIKKRMFKLWKDFHMYPLFLTKANGIPKMLSEIYSRCLKNILNRNLMDKMKKFPRSIRNLWLIRNGLIVWSIRSRIIQYYAKFFCTSYKTISKNTCKTAEFRTESLIKKLVSFT